MLDIPWSGVKTCSGVNVTPAFGNSSSPCYTLGVKTCSGVNVTPGVARALRVIPWSGVKTCSGVNVTPGVGNSSSAGYTLVRCKNLLWR